MGKRLLFVLSFLGAIIVRGHSGNLVAQSSDPHRHQHAAAGRRTPLLPTGVSPLPVAVVGAENPERIPDDLAYIHFISSVSIKSDSSPNEVRRRKAILASTGLPDHDVQAIVKALDGMREQLTVLDNERKQITPETANTIPGRVQAASLQTRRRGLMASARARIIAALSADGMGVLHEHVQRKVKPRIVIYGDPRP